MVYSNKYNEAINVNSYKSKSNMNFNKKNQNFEKGGIIYNDYVIGTKTLGTPNYRLRDNKIDNTHVPYERLSSHNFTDQQIKQNIKNSSCHNEKHHLQNINELNTLIPNNPDIQQDLNQARQDLNDCVDTFFQSYKNPDTNVTRRPTSNILPDNYPYKDTEVFGEDLQSCRDSQQYFNSIDLNLPIQENNLKPKYGTTRALNNDIVGPRVFDGYENINKQTPLNTMYSGYNIQENQQNYNKVMVKVDEEYTDREVGDIKTKPYETIGYKNKDTVYNGSCGSKTNFMAITDKLERQAHLSEFVKNNIIGNNYDNVNHSSLYHRNKATFNNKDLQNNNPNLNTIKQGSHTNFIDNTNKLREEFKIDYFKQHTHKMQNNLNNRG